MKNKKKQLLFDIFHTFASDKCIKQRGTQDADAPYSFTTERRR
ncbi:hypothetical protein HMPREF0653_01445 [Prevotella disiens JCM 6334 = ATCC 29426]|uniref:Uncharacterized protein n=1 Tax=Prevotella disiens JCM 6334 = ATCC 29426 TaxID=1235811 RepID=A0ABP2Y6Y4_9BACT|nr:hypothetical protein HMPREF0653_01445 [Prevotella disiens JCM 6334 = ATCC 29426]